MSSGIYLVDGDGELLRMEEAKYDSEDLLQALLEQHPDLMPGDQVDSAEPRRWMLVKREAGVPSSEAGADRWSADHLFIDQDAIPTIVEVKRSTNTEIRREIVGQMLDYAANGTKYWPIGRIMDDFAETCRERGEEPSAALELLLEAPSETLDVDEFWSRVETNLRAGRIRMVFVADRIPRTLQRIVEFLNEQMRPAEVLAVEIKQFSDGTQAAYVPRVIGQTAQAQDQKAAARSQRPNLTEESFLIRISENNGQSEAKTAKDILDWAGNAGLRVRYGRQCFVLDLRVEGVTYYVAEVGVQGTFRLRCKHLFDTAAFPTAASLEAFVERFSALPDADVPDDRAGPSVPLASLSKEGVAEALFRILGDLIAHVTAVHRQGKSEVDDG